MLRAINICKSYRDGSHVTPVLHDVTLQVPSHQMLAIVGSSGSGKSTLLGLLAGACAHPPGAPALETDARCAPGKPCPACPACPGSEGQAAAAVAPPPLQASNWQAVTGWLQDDPAQAWPALRASCAIRRANWIEPITFV